MMVEPLAYKIAARYVLRHFKADSIADVPKLVHEFAQFVQEAAKWEPEIPKMKQAQAEMAHPSFEEDEEMAKVIRRYYESHIYDFMFFPKFSYNRLHRIDMPDLWWGLLQQYDLTPALRKKVETAAKFYARSRVNKPDRKDAVEAYEKVLAIYRDQLETAKTALATTKPRGQGGDTGINKTLKAGPFTIVNTGGFDEATMQECARVVEEASKLLHAKGLGKVCYGEVLISNTLRQKTVLAFYLPAKDEMFVRANLKGHEHDAVRTVCHELGHRLEEKFMKDKKLDIGHMHHVLTGKQNSLDRENISALMKDPEKKPKPGDTLESKGKTYVVDGLEYKRTLKVLLHKADDPKIKASVPLEGYFKMKGLKAEIPAKHSGFVTGYAATNDSENFAEMIAYWCLNKLPEDQVEMLHQIGL